MHKSTIDLRDVSRIYIILTSRLCTVRIRPPAAGAETIARLESTEAARREPPAGGVIEGPSSPLPAPASDTLGIEITTSHKAFRRRDRRERGGEEAMRCHSREQGSGACRRGHGLARPQVQGLEICLQGEVQGQLQLEMGPL